MANNSNDAGNIKYACSLVNVLHSCIGLYI